jgi:hypothetical protein
MDGYQLGNQDLDWVFPYHAGAISYYQEKGVWSDEHEAYNNALLKRQDILVAAWEDVMSRDIADDQFETEWLKARATALEAAGMPVPFR